MNHRLWHPSFCPTQLFAIIYVWLDFKTGQTNRRYPLKSWYSVFWTFKTNANSNSTADFTRNPCDQACCRIKHKIWSFLEKHKITCSGSEKQKLSPVPVPANLLNFKNCAAKKKNQVSLLAWSRLGSFLAIDLVPEKQRVWNPSSSPQQNLTRFCWKLSCYSLFPWTK